MQNLKLLIVFLFSASSVWSQVDISIEKNLLTSAPFQYGTNLAYEIKITNTGNQAITNIVLRDLVPCGLAYLSSSQPWTAVGSDRTTTITNIINPSESFSTFIDFTLVSCTTLGAWNNRSEIISFTNTTGNLLTDPNVNNNSDSVEADVYDLAMHKKLITSEPYAYDDILEFEITVFNQGNRPVNTVTVRDFVPILSGFTFDPTINAGWTGSAPTISRIISTPINPGGSAAVRIKLKLVRTAGGARSWLNYAEIRFATDAMSNLIFDADSTPGSNSISENDVLPGDPDDDNLLTRGPEFNEDEDDHDPANALVFDLALTKDQKTALSSFSYIQNVAYIFTVYNQGNTPATNIRVADYLSPALSYTPSALNILRGWTFDNSTQVASINFSNILQPGQLDTFILDLKPNQFYVDQDMAWADFGEITQADDTNPLTPNPIADIDSKPDNIQTNDGGGKPNSPSDNATNGNGTGTYLSPDPLTDEDDHDVHKIQIVDLALTKKVVGSTSRAVGDQVVFEIKIVNQGNVPLRNIEIIDSIGVGYTFTPGGVNAGWINTLPRLRKILTPVLLPMHDTTIFITLNVINHSNPNAYTNFSEVVIAQDTFGFNRNDDADSVFDDKLYNDNLALPGSPDDNNIFGDANLEQDEDDHDVAGITILCEKPTLTVGISRCDALNGVYDVIYYSNVLDITSTEGLVTETGVFEIPLGTDVTITAANGAGCITSLTVPALTSCPPTNICVLPKLTVGQPICNGNSYTVSWTNDIGILSTTAGVISGNSIINIPIGTNIIVTSTNNTCITSVRVISPTDCETPCTNSPITLSGPICEPGKIGTYKINYILLPGSTLTTNFGIIGSDMITNIPSSVRVTLTVTTPNCITRVLTLPIIFCQTCQNPTLTVGIPTCNSSSSTYNITYYSDAQNITSTAGIVTPNMITNIPLGTSAIITSSYGDGCTTTLTVPGLNTCPPNGGCSLPKLTVGQPMCNGTSTYSVSFTNDQGTLSTTAGTISTNSIINIPVGTNITVTSTNSTCITSVQVTSPTNCNIPCRNPAISISGPICNGNGSETYTVNYILLPSASILTNVGTISSTAITNIPSGTNLIITVANQACNSKIITIPAANCIICRKPTLTTGIPVCVPGSNTYSITYYSSSSNITSSAGTVTPTSITNIPINVNVVVTAITDIGCSTSLTIPALNICPDPNVCTSPKLTVGQPLCNGTTYSVSYTHDVGTMSISAGNISGNNIINIPLGTNLIVTATNNTCLTRVQVTAPTDCNIPCSNPAINISGPICDATGSGTYTVNYILSTDASITTNVGNVNNGTVTDIPSGTNLVIVLTSTGCNTKIITVPAAICQLCQKPTLSIGIPVCNALGTSYSVTYYSNVVAITNSTGVLDLETINNIPFGIPITVTATSAPGCTTSLTMPALASCPTSSGCTLPRLTVGQPLCNGNTYTVSYTHDLGILTTTAGSIVGNSIINIPIGTNIMVTATNAACISRVNVSSPVGCNTPCINSPITISGPVCQNDPNFTYKINYSIAQGSTVTTSAGILTPDSVTDIPSGTPVTLTINTPGCITRIVNVPGAVCQVPLGNISTFVWHDINGDGQQNSGESGIPAVFVMLFSSSNVMIASTYTDALGNANFNNVPAGFYYMKYTNASTYSVTLFDRGSDNTDSDINNSNGAGTTPTFQVFSNQTTSNVDAGYYICIPVGDLAWYDNNKNDKFDTYENGINGIDISIWRREGSIWVIWDQTLTGQKPNSNSDDGWWKFCVPPGQYYVSYELPPIGLVAAQPDLGGNEENDSDITGIYGYGTTSAFTVSSGQMKCDIGGGFYPMAVLGNLVWYDINADGIQDQGEAKVPNVLVEALDPITDDILTSTETNSDGIYTLDYLQQRDYYLRFTPPAGFQATLPLMLNDGTIDSDVDHSNGYNTTATKSMASGQQDQGVDMGVVFAPLPVTWQDIRAYRKSDHHLVTWSVSREWNTSHYIVQRQKITESKFNKISQEIKIEGSRTNDKKYSFQDTDIANGGTYFYRVIAIDFDGKIDYSQVVSVRQDGAFNVEVYPNPSNSLANISIEIPAEMEVDIKLYAADGRLIKNILSHTKMSQGSHVIAIPLTDITAGVYKLIIEHNGNQEVKKLIRMN